MDIESFIKGCPTVDYELVLYPDSFTRASWSCKCLGRVHGSYSRPTRKGDALTPIRRVR